MEKEKNNKIFFNILAVILLFLILLTFLILIVRIGNFAPIDKNTIFLVEKNFRVATDDKDKIWDTKSDIDIFDSSITNKDEIVIVKSENGDNLIAPGTFNEYTFNLKNTGNIAIDYDVNMRAILKINNVESSFENFPIVVRLKNYNGEYLLGNDETWLSIEEINDFLDQGILGVNNYAYYTLEWKWDGKDDKLDTALGTSAVSNDIDLIVEISTSSTPAEKPSATGGIIQVDNDLINQETKIGGTIKVIPFTILIILIILISITLIILKRKNKVKK
ncbi:MAG: hypothetical protein IJB71_05085 [Bacilli bacterium]|nr:hypothetical protein [Bacilli bacterium]